MRILSSIYLEFHYTIPLGLFGTLLDLQWIGHSSGYFFVNSFGNFFSISFGNSLRKILEIIRDLSWSIFGIRFKFIGNFFGIDFKFFLVVPLRFRLVMNWKFLRKSFGNWSSNSLETSFGNFFGNSFSNLKISTTLPLVFNWKNPPAMNLVTLWEFIIWISFDNCFNCFKN